MSTNFYNSNNQEIITVAHPSVFETGFTQVKNEIINNDRLSPAATLLIIYLTSKPRFRDDGSPWQFHDWMLAKRLHCSLSKLKDFWKELRIAGYIRTTPIQNENGTMCGSRREFSLNPIFVNKNNDETMIKSNDQKNPNNIRYLKNEQINDQKNVNKINAPTESADYRQSVKPTGRQTILSAPYINNTDLVNNTNHTQDLFLNNKNKYMCENFSPATESRSSLLENKIKNEKASRSEAELVFDRLWAEYPVKKGRSKALERFLRKTRNLTSDQLKNSSETILDRLMMYALEKELYARARKQYPHLNTFCPTYQNGDRWFGSTCWSDDKYLTTYDEVCHEITNRPENINKKQSRSQAMASIFSGGQTNV